MSSRQEEKLKSLIACEPRMKNLTFKQWFLKQFESSSANSCTLEEFALYFLNSLRQHTEVHLKTYGTETPKCQTPLRVIKANNTREESSTCRSLLMDLSRQGTSVASDNNLSLKSNSYNEYGSYSTPRLSTSVDRLVNSQKNATSTPVKSNLSNNSKRLSTSASASRSMTPSFCLGDFMVLNTSSHNRSHKKKNTSTTNTKTSQNMQTDKPIKRLQPISISKKSESANNSSIFAGESSFRNENNILKISNTELDDKDKCTILAARKSLKLNASEITKEIQDISMPSILTMGDTIISSTPAKDTMPEEIPLDLEKLENNLTLKKLAEIYSIIIDLNLTTNILNELSFLLNLLNASNCKKLTLDACKNMDQLHLYDADSIEGLECLKDFSNAVYFALLSLTQEKQTLGLLDTKSLGVVVISERFSYLPDHVKSFLLETYQSKQQLLAEKPFCETSIYFDSKPWNNVYFQHEQDSRQNFSSHQEFSSFRVQRDLFYKCFKMWESNHLNPTWKFSLEVTPKIRELFQHSENCINMAHLAKLFVSQLLLSASNAASPEEIGLAVDSQKLTKLAQRLIAPSQFSVDYQFPHAQAFFRDFIIEARSQAFAEQLKLELYTELISKNDHSIDFIDVNRAENDPYEKNLSLVCPYYSDNVIVRPEILNSMLILAKFLGFTTSLPFNLNSSNMIPAQVEKTQIKLRSLIQPTFDVCVIIKQGIEQGKLLIIIPWLVQYLAMLDNITLQLEPYMKALKLIFALYLYLGFESPKPFKNTSIFIIRLCIGWLFESKQFIAEYYYHFMSVFNDSSTNSYNELAFVKSKLKRNIDTCSESENLALNPHLESILPVACQFLAEFRVSIMPAKYAQTKNASRSGRYRHITTRIAELSSSPQIKEDINSLNFDQDKRKEIQKKLIQAFLHSQNSTTRYMIDFCTERCYKCTVKDGQLKILLPAKNNADNLVNQITSFNYDFVYNTVKTIYSEARSNVKTEWMKSIPSMLDKRIHNALESLLPEETSPVLKKTYFMIIKREAYKKTFQWYNANIVNQCCFLYINLEEMASKLCKANQNKVHMGPSNLCITKESPSISELIDELQYWLHCTSIRLDRFENSEPLIRLMKSLTEIFDNILPSLLYHLIGTSIIKLLQHIIAKYCSQLSDELIEAVCHVWLHPNMQKYASYSSGTSLADQTVDSSPSFHLYDALVTIPFIESLGTKADCFHKLAHLIVAMIKKRIISPSYANELFVPILKYDWPPSVMTEISNVLNVIAKETVGVCQQILCDNNDSDNDNYYNNNVDDNDDINDNDNDEQSNYFMNMLSDVSKDVDFF